MTSKPQSPKVFAEDALIASICRESFYHFVKEFWDVVVQDAPVLNWHIKYICDEVQKVAERVIRNEPKEYDLIVNVPPGSTKSTLVSILLPPWIWTRMRRCRIISTSYEASLALTFSRKSRNVIEHPKYQRIFGACELRDDQNAKGHYENTEGGERKAVGAGGNITGNHGHIIIVDDPINPKKAASEATLAEINTWMDETLPTRKVNKENTPTILIMQRLHQDDPTGHVMAKRKKNVKHICIPATISEKVMPTKLRRFYKDGLMDPVRLSKRVLEEARKDLGEYGYAGQFDQSPVPAGGGQFKVQRLVLDTPPPWTEFAMLVRYWDKAGTGGAGAYTVGTLLGKDRHNRIWILDVVRGQWDSFERERTIKQTAELDTRRVIIGLEQEPGSGGKESAQNTVRNLLGFRVVVDRPTGDKALRADPLSTQVNAGNVYVAKDRPWNREWIEEFRFFPFSTYKDQVDSASGGFALLTKGKLKRGAL